MTHDALTNLTQPLNHGGLDGTGRSGYRNRNHWCYDAAGKDFYEALVGVRVADFTVVSPGETSAIRFGDSEGEAYFLSACEIRYWIFELADMHHAARKIDS
jgi:hypothetical protein